MKLFDLAIRIANLRDKIRDLDENRDRIDPEKFTTRHGEYSTEIAVMIDKYNEILDWREKYRTMRQTDETTSDPWKKKDLADLDSAMELLSVKYNFVNDSYGAVIVGISVKDHGNKRFWMFDGRLKADFDTELYLGVPWVSQDMGDYTVYEF